MDEKKVLTSATPLLTIFDSFVRPFARENQIKTNVINVDENWKQSENSENSNEELLTANQGEKSRRSKVLPNFTGDDPSKKIRTVSDYLLTRRKRNYGVWHKRFFLLEEGFFYYGKSESDVKSGRRNAKIDLGKAYVSSSNNSCRFDIDLGNSIHHVRTKNRRTFEILLEQIPIHIALREKQINAPRQNSKDGTTKLKTDDFASKTPQFAEDFRSLNSQLKKLSSRLDQIKQNGPTRNSTRFSEPSKAAHGHKHSASVSGISSFLVVDTTQENFYDDAKKLLDDLQNVFQRLTHWTIEQQEKHETLLNSFRSESRNCFHSFSSTDNLSQQGSIFFDAADTAHELSDFDEKDEAEKLDSDGSSSDEEENGDEMRTPSANFSSQLKALKPRWRRSSLPHKTPDNSDFGLWNIMRRAIGRDLSKVTLPVVLNEPLGVLQRLCEEIEYSDLLDRASLEVDPQMRLVLVSAFVVSTYSSNFYRTGRKNFNPLLGETFECVRDDKGWKFFSEQVSHHPPISVGYCQSNNFRFSQTLKVKIKFWGKSMEIVPDSINILYFPKFNETITWNKCTMCIHNVFSPSRWIDQYGDVNVKSSLGSTAQIKFFQSDFPTRSNEIFGEIHNPAGKLIHRIFGRWHEEVFFGNDQNAKSIWRQSAVPENSKFYYGFTKFAIELNELDDELRKELPPTDTRFRPDQRLFEQGQMERAEEKKSQLEKAQRLRAETDFTPNWFEMRENSFAPILHDEETALYWKKREESWKSVYFVNLW